MAREGELRIAYEFGSEAMFNEADLRFRFVIREAIRHAKEYGATPLTDKEIIPLLEDETQRLAGKE